jgi:hypothetical protein
MNEQDFTILGINSHAIPPEDDIDPEEFAANMLSIIKDYEESTDGSRPPFTHVLAAIMMEVFQPGFIIIGSPITIPHHDGVNLPADVGVLINANTEHTATTVGHFLGLLAQIIDESAESGLIDLTTIYGEGL